eukprot:1415632-Prymnesium_polylepis.1
MVAMRLGEGRPVARVHMDERHTWGGAQTGQVENGHVILASWSSAPSPRQPSSIAQSSSRISRKQGELIPREAVL